MAVLLAGGFDFAKKMPEVDELNFAPRVKVPTLLVDGRYDEFFPLETSQYVMFRFLGRRRTSAMRYWMGDTSRRTTRW
jgi:eukaryotic-like serine/threonine-protein kinase